MYNAINNNGKGRLDMNKVIISEAEIRELHRIAHLEPTDRMNPFTEAAMYLAQKVERAGGISEVESGMFRSAMEVCRDAYKADLSDKTRSHFTTMHIATTTGLIDVLLERIENSEEVGDIWSFHNAA